MTMLAPPAIKSVPLPRKVRVPVLHLLEEAKRSTVILSKIHGSCALEEDAFPFEALSEIAEIESWRKEINRPSYHIHKWWAQRLGTIFRAIVLGAFAPKGSNLMDLFYQPVRLPKNATVLDPFMGSGTTIGETLKLGGRAIGRDINPVAYFLVHNAVAMHDREAILKTFLEIEQDVAEQLRYYYSTTLPDGRTADVLYFFWVKQLDCPACEKSVDMFSSYIFAQHAYPKRYPKAQAVCPGCGTINETEYNTPTVCCKNCNDNFDPQKGPACGQKAHCPYCSHNFSIAKTSKNNGKAPTQRMYAKLVLMPDGSKAYMAVTLQDETLFAEALRALAGRTNAYPIVPIVPGHNTNQVLGYNYHYWHEMFNARQLLCISILSERIKQVIDTRLRELFVCLLSGTLEFNNMFTSYKGEGTGAVRHMFAHHILKPERMPLEANIWGTPKSSGSFSTIFNGRIRRALDYAENPFELRVGEKAGRKCGEKVYSLSEPIGFSIAETFPDLAANKQVYLSCGDSSKTDLPDHSVDAIITDPPFFDNVHYSELADFFHIWQRHILGRNEYREADTTRSSAEVQHSDSGAFTERLTAVFKESHRVLKDAGLLVFTYHHSRLDGWRSILAAIMRSGFEITAVQPVKAEMSGAMPKLQAKEPINLDIIMVCRKRLQPKQYNGHNDLWAMVMPLAQNQVARFFRIGRRLSRNDVRVIITAQFLRQLSMSSNIDTALHSLDANRDELEARIEHIFETNNN